MKILAVSALLCALMALTTSSMQPVADDDILDSFEFPWVPIGRRYFYYVTRPLTWPEAESNCRSLGGHLASVESLEEYDLMRSLIRGSKSDPLVWLGGCDRFKEGEWEWIDGSPFNFTYWCPAEPNNKRNEDCLQMNFGNCKCWNDKGCGHRLTSYCIKAS
ncbi:type-2 ice-structuring protein-like [Halichoeres trimaculatus]|uniref:type-2 ice-structuring protein-like n=1 Tax=Halichoeres trimaculatus TaxID=147232 RepID=UPI003D9E6EF8